MQKSQNQSHQNKRKTFPPLETITRPNLTTDEAAFYCNRKPQTLRIWAMKENGLIRPIRQNGRLAWPTKEVKRVNGIDE
ncbi:hypothetical protein [Nitrosomonas sp. Nm33]|uniref:hypothetical protein n=1 Tax=Nitrosomonas sp. Nm33 TaxID=133724 RepID=UPI000899BAF0|nr:hypothetical protein [Nitrosomonas sp. Nm33]SDY63988.1 hypothetical protein SAMN05421755_103531 [Nitrosomonas sp. Nm33]